MKSGGIVFIKKRRRTLFAYFKSLIKISEGFKK